MTKLFAQIRQGISLMTVSLLMKQLGLGLLLVILSLIWLKIPDASVFNIVTTVVLGLIILATAGAGQSWILLGAAQQKSDRKRLAKGALIVIATVALWLGWSALLQHWQTADELRAGYLNSSLPHGLRNVFSYAHILSLLQFTWSGLEWLVTGVMIVFAASFLISPRPVQRAWQTVRSLYFWFTYAVVVLVLTVALPALISWLPGHGIATEMTSLVVRLLGAVVLGSTAICYLLATLAVCIGANAYSTPAGTPSDSHLRTEESP